MKRKSFTPENWGKEEVALMAEMPVIEEPNRTRINAKIEDLKKKLVDRNSTNPTKGI